MWALGFIISLLIGLVVGHFMIPILHKLKFGQSIREEGPKSHQAKQGTPENWPRTTRVMTTVIIKRIPPIVGVPCFA